MKKSFLRILLVLAGLASLAISAKAQGPDQVLVKVPFPFVAAGQTFQAGEYRVTRLRDEQPTVLLLINQEEHTNLVVLLTESQSAPHGKPQLAFATVEGQHFLSRVNTGDHTYNLSVPQTEALLASNPSKAVVSSDSGSN
ncbi:MAG TPA: hypothetical protein VJN92_05880 [Candidatus Acidoferrum sp.]|nr:hypothetical protein [Candidatus Acidoferrum sp.]